MQDMKFCPLYSGSSGNALFVEYGHTRLLVDAGKSGKMIADALRFIGVDPATLSGLLITHEHSDHISGAGIVARKWKLPVYATAATWQAMEEKIGPIPPEMKRVFQAGEDFFAGDVGVQPFSVSHDAADPCGYRFWGGGVSVSTCTDLGYYAESVHNAISGSSLVLLESNHDPDRLRRNDRYSSRLKQRILGRKGHLSNESCAEAVVRLAESGVKYVVLGHLSGENNDPGLALSTTQTRAELEGIVLGRDLCLDVACRDRVGSVYSVVPESVSIRS